MQRLRTIWPGLVFMGGGVAITAQGLTVGPSSGAPALVAFAAGMVFLLGGVVLIRQLAGAGDTLLQRTLVALVVTGLASVAIVLPPILLLISLPFVGLLAVLAWIAVGRLAAERITGRDPLARWSQERVLGLGAGATALLAAGILAAWGLRACAPPSGEGLTPEAEQAAGPVGSGPSR